MTRSSKNTRGARSRKKPEIELSRSRGGADSSLSKYSRYSDSAGYAKQRKKRSRKKRILVTVLVTLLALLLAGGAGAFAFVWSMNNSLRSGIDLESINAATVDRGKPEDPFWMLLVGTDDRVEGEAARSDTMILAYIDPGHKAATLISIPRDCRVSLAGYGYVKINAAYTYGSLAEDQGHSGPEFAINAVSDLTGVGIAGYVQIDFSGFKNVVDALGGVNVEVPMDIYDFDTGSYEPSIYAGSQKLDGNQALLFVRSRDFDIGDYQRQANQRTFLQALARQVLDADPVTILNTVTKICEMTSTNLSVGDIGEIAGSMRGMKESDIYTYSIPCYSDNIDGVSYEIPDVNLTRTLIKEIEAGNHPSAEELNLTRQGEAPADYKASDTPITADKSQNTSSVNTADYTVDVRNGYGIVGSATSVSDMLALAGYKQGEIGNANSYVYKETLVIYRDEGDLAAANDIRSRLGFGRVIPSLDRYDYAGDILVVVGGDFKT